MGAHLLMAFLTTPWRKMANTNNGKKNACHATMFDGSTTIQVKGMCKAH
jgi:hypothetical protein